MTNTFKVGDRVERIRYNSTQPHRYGRIGDKGTITKIDGWDNPVVKWDNIPLCHGSVSRGVLKVIAPAPRFKAGDKVRTVRAYNYYGVGMTGTVGPRGLFDCYLDIVWDKDAKLTDGTPAWNGGFFPDHFELVPASEVTAPSSAFKVGDRVRFKDAKASNGFTPGEVGVISNITSPQDGPEALIYVGFKGAYARRFELLPASAATAPAPEAPKPERAATSRRHWIVAILADDGTPLPSKKPFTHETEAAAEAEATRLMNATPGKTFVVYRAAKSFMKPTAAARVTTY